ncbi:MAG: GNAT family N-acetyltransferase [Comamonadaceae bacterium]|nr:MAG: GNAT family N-acetyltransferase [Comamonadaceae bacterium]
MRVEKGPVRFSPGSEIDWQFKAFGELSLHELYALLQLRSEVFVVEQACIFQDLDGNDDRAMHLIGWHDGRVAAYARCFGPGVTYDEASIGRVITSDALRGTGAGHVLIRKSIEGVKAAWGDQVIRIGAQARLERFYQGHGFEKTGEAYMEDGIEHIHMLRQASPKQAKD